jgi:NitT/TauT family transport system permease protein
MNNPQRPQIPTPNKNDYRFYHERANMMSRVPNLSVSELTNNVLGTARDRRPEFDDCNNNDNSYNNDSCQRKSRLGKTNPKLRKLILGSIIPATLLIVWSIITAISILPQALLPTPIDVFHAIQVWAGEIGGNAFYYNTLWQDIAATVSRVIIGFGAACVFGIATGTLMGISHFFESLLNPIFRILGPIPPITWIPVVVVFLGVGSLSVWALTFFGSFVPVAAASAVAVAGVNRDYLRVARMVGRSRWSTIRSVVIPAALPSILGGMRIGLGLSWMMAVTAEMLAVHSGLGYMLWNAYNYLDYPAVYAAMIVIGLCGLLTDGLIRVAAKRFVAWHVATGVRA